MSLTERLTLAGLLVTIIGVLVALTTYLFPHGEAGGTGAPPEPGRSPDPVSTNGRSTPNQSASPAEPSADYLATFPVHAGGVNLTNLPRELRDTPGLDQAIMIECPSNQSNDKVREVTYQLLGRYDTFRATVRPHFTSRPDAVMHVDALTGERARDGSLIWTKRGGQYAATADQPAPLTVVVEGAEELKIQVRCELPDGVAILMDAAVDR